MINQAKHLKPPVLLEKLLIWVLPTDLVEPLLGDLEEEYLTLCTTHPIRAKYWYTTQSLRTCLGFLTKTKRGIIMFLASILVFVSFVVMTMILSGDISMYVNLPSLLLVLPPTLLVTLASSTNQARKHALLLLLGESISLSKLELNAAKHLYVTFGNMSLLMGFIGVAMGAIAIAENLRDISHFGAAFAVAMSPLYYALVLKALCYAAQTKIQTIIINEE